MPTPFYDEPAFQQAAMLATQAANRSGESVRIVRANGGGYFIRRADLDFVGEHVSFVNPDKACRY